jgi:hypothetical protein
VQSSQIQELKDELTGQKRKISELEQQTKELEQHTSELEQQTKELEQHTSELEQQTKELEQLVTDMQVVLPDKYVENTTNSTVKIIENGISEGIGFFMKADIIGTVLHNLYESSDPDEWNDEYIGSSITNGTAVFHGKMVSGEDITLTLHKYSIKYDFAVLKSNVCSPNFLSISSCASLREWFKGLAVTSFQIGTTSSVSDADIVSESFTVVPAILLRKSAHHILYSAGMLLAGDSGGAVVTSTDGNVVAIHVECFNEANEALDIDAAISIKDVATSINSLTRGMGQGYFGLRLDSKEVQEMLT